MVQNLRLRSIAEFAAMSQLEASALLATARELLTPGRDGTTHRLLRGKNLALLCDGEQAIGRGAVLFQRAATGLGAKVAQLRPSLTDESTPAQVLHTASILGRLYDGIECVGMSPGLVLRIGVAADVPVFEGMSAVDHPTSLLACRLDQGIEFEDNRCAVMQAVLIGALG
jgi:ornithine carbamoyltransferase